MHDLGLAATAIELLAVVIGLGAGLATAAWRLEGGRRWVGVAGAIVTVVIGLFVVKVTIGM